MSTNVGNQSRAANNWLCTVPGFALNFSDDEFNPEELHVLQHLMSQVPHARFVVQPGSETSYGHLTMAHPDLWAQHVAEFMRELGDAPPGSGERG
jgi:homoserine O-acetyltransferase